MQVFSLRLLFRLVDLCPAITQANRAIENRVFNRRFNITDKITESFELVGKRVVSGIDRWFEHGILANDI